MTAREVALQVVRDVFPAAPQSSERGAQEAFDYRASKSGLDARDRAFATELAYGSIKMRRTLDWYLQPFIGQRSQPLPDVISEILRLAIYEIAFTRADEHATVFEFVNLAKKYGHKGVAGLTNAVLRSFLRDRPPAPTRDLFDDDDEYVGVAYSLPTWIVRQWRAAFAKDVETICAAVNDPPATAITVNGARASVEGILESLQLAGVQARRSAFVEESVVVEDGAYARAHERAASGGWWVQSESSAMPVAMLNPQPGETALDVASGRGSKALQIAARAGGTGTLLCIERDERKAKILENRMSGAGLAAGVLVGDATTDLLPAGQRFDRVLVDAPCSGIGVIGRHPEARWCKRADDGERLRAVQIAMLDAVSRHVHEGGVLVYAVCSTDPRETTQVVDSFLRAHDFARGLTPGVFEPFLTPEGDTLVTPGVDGRDGFYMARLERRL